MIRIGLIQMRCEKAAIDQNPSEISRHLRDAAERDIDIVGLPDSAVKEARERVRVGIRNCGFRFPSDRILVNLSPAGIRKEGASYDLAIALGILAASEQVPLARSLRIMHLHKPETLFFP